MNTIKTNKNLPWVSWTFLVFPGQETKPCPNGDLPVNMEGINDLTKRLESDTSTINQIYWPPFENRNLLSINIRNLKAHGTFLNRVRLFFFLLFKLLFYYMVDGSHCFSPDKNQQGIQNFYQETYYILYNKKNDPQTGITIWNNSQLANTVIRNKNTKLRQLL